MAPDQFDAWLRDPDRRPLVMGVLNVTPDSFSDGGQFYGTDAAVARAEAMAAEGTDWIDIGGESTRPGSRPVEPVEQIRRVVPVVKAIRGRGLNVILSIDTTRAAVASAVLAEGVSVINDISAGRDDPPVLQLAARTGCPIILMHMQGTPETMQMAPTYRDVTAEVGQFLQDRAQVAVAAGVARERVLLDPGIGFGKTVSHNLQLLRRLPELASLGYPLVVGASRKGFIGKVLGQSDPERRVYGTAATVAWSVANGAAVVRVHDVEPMSQVVRIVRAIQHPPGD
ncbi:MAG TPA: dihydropteroate synthase [Tepidisphaeraceae bacterium]|nr:dihydropteroate synthase [Tepidisphaeraceae bacterium]